MPDPSPAEAPSAYRRPLDELIDELAAERVLERTWSSRRGDLRLYRSGADDAVVVKRLPPHQGPMAPIACDVMARCLRASADDPRGSVMPEPVAWGDDPPYLAYQWVEGQPLDSLITGASAEAAPDVPAMASAAAAAVARFHGAFPVARGIGGSMTVRSLWDPGPHNTVIGSEGTVRLIDPPGFIEEVAPEHDVAVLVHHLSWSTQRSGRAMAPGPLLDAAADGYRREAGPDGPPLDRRRLDHELARATFARLRARTRKIVGRRLPLSRAHPIDMARQAGWALRADLRARRIPPRSSKRAPRR
jgi:hypothetical protein